MTFADLLRDTYATLRAHWLRTALTMFGIAWGIVSIMLMIAAGEGLREGQAQVAATLGKDLMIVFAGRTSMQAGGQRSGRATRWEASDAESVAQNAPSCRFVLPELGRGSLRVGSAHNNASLMVTGSMPAFSELRSIGIGDGRWYNEDDSREGRRVAFLGNDAREQLFAERRAVGETVSIGGLPYLVIGAMTAKNQNSAYDGFDAQKVFVPFTAMLRDFPHGPPLTPTSIDRLLVAPRSVFKHEDCKREVRQALARIHGFDPRDEEAAPIWDTVREAQAFQRMTDGMKYFLGAVGVATLLIGAIGVINVMLVAVRERTREIGIRKALGASQRSILRQFFVETMIVVFASGGLGISVAWLICTVINLVPMPPFFAGMLLSWRLGLIISSLLGTVAVLAAVYPASRAARTDPIEALRYEPGG